MSTVLQRLLPEQKDQIMEHLDEIEERRFISRCKDEEWIGVRSKEFTFVTRLMQQIIYEKLDDDSRFEKHQEIAKILEGILNDLLDKNPQLATQQKLMIQIARHYDLGDEPLRAAHYYYKSAQSTFYTGAMKETTGLCELALEKIRSLPKGVSDNDKLHAEIIGLKLGASEIWWRGNPGSENKWPESEILVEEAEESAIRTGDQSLIARIKYLKGKILLTTYSLDSSIQVLEEALKMTRDCKDWLTESFIMGQLGSFVLGNRTSNTYLTFDSGLELLYNAYNLFENHVKSELNQNLFEDLNTYLYGLQGRIGIGEFDRGNFGETRKWIDKSITGLRKPKKPELSRSLSFLGQLYTAIGQFESAEDTLSEAISVINIDESSILRGYNMALLGKLYMEWCHIAQAEKPLLEGLKETEDIWQVDIVPVIRNYYTELLMHSGYKGYNLDKAEQCLKITVKEVKTTKFYRSLIVALSLWGKLALIQEDIDSALKHSTEAVNYLEKMGTMPLVRMEEIFFNHYSILKAAGNSQDEAKPYLERAHYILQQKANSLENEDYKRTFLERVPLSQEIISSIKNENDKMDVFI